MKRVIAMVITLGLAFILFAFNVYAASPDFSQYMRSDKILNGVNATAYVRCMLPFSEEIEFYDNASGYEAATTRKIIVTITYRNTTSINKYVSANRLVFDFTAGNTTLVDTLAVTDIENFSSNFQLSMYNTSFEVVPSAEFTFGTGFVIPANTNLSCVAVLTMPATCFVNTQGSFAYRAATLNSVTIDYSCYDTEFSPLVDNDDILISLEALRNYLIGNNGIPLIDSDLDQVNSTLSVIKDLLQELNDNMGSSDYSGTIDDSNDLQTTESQVHQQEQQWYAENKTAIEATGLGNYQYSSGLIDSFGVARYQIAMLWNALGDWTYVYYLVFLLGLAVYILRHEPTMRVKQMRADREARMQENKIYTDASRNVRMQRDADYARYVGMGFGRRRR